MKRNLILAALLAAIQTLNAASFPADSGWKRYTSVAGNYYVQLPAQPQFSNREVQTVSGPVVLNQVTSEPGGRILYAVMHCDYASTPADLGRFYDSVRDGQSQGGTVIAERLVYKDGYPARLVRIEKEGYVIFTMNISVGRRLYQLMALYPRGNESLDTAGYFFDSFHLRQ